MWWQIIFWILTCTLLLIMRKREAFKVSFQASSNQLMQCKGRSTLGQVVQGERQPPLPKQGFGGESKEAGWRVIEGI